MPYRGFIKQRQPVHVTFTCFPTNSGPALVLVGCGDLGGGANPKGDVAAPGGSVGVDISCTEPGIFKVDVDMASDTDSGEIEVQVNGQVVDKGRLAGDTVWSYSIV